MFTQQNRIITLTTPLGEDALILTSLRGREGISQLFHFEMEVVWQKPAPLKFTDLLGKTVAVKIDDEDPPRFINGLVQSVEQGEHDPERDLTNYTLHVVPNTWVLTRNVQSRIFQQKSVPDIVKEVIAGMGFSATLKNSLQGSYQPRDYCVQYRESDFAFISRLMESEGIFYFYQHDSMQHTLVIADKGTSFQDVPSGAEIEYEPVLGGNREKSRIFEWVKAQEIRSGKYTQTDWNFETPSTSLLTDDLFPQRVANNQQLEIFEYPGGYMQKSEGETLTENRVQEENTPGLVTRGKSWHSGLCPGYKFTLQNHYSEDGKYVLTSVEHFAEEPFDVGAGVTPFEYENRFTTVSADVIYRPPRVTPLPRIQGVQTAIVVGPGGEEIYTDKYGRVKVQFHWDRVGTNDENSSCWMRVATFWAGKNWGAIHIPRIGQEVIVDFEEGDPDRPLIVGSVYNAAQMPPYSLPGERTKSTLQSRSSKGGGTSNFNEIRFEDKTGSEEVYFQAEKDLNSLVKNDETRTVKHDRTTTIGNDETKKVTANETITIDQGNQSTTLNQGDQSTKISMGNQSIELNMGDQSTKLDLGAATTEAMQSITLKVGQSSIVIDQMGVTIKGMMISIEGQVQVDVKGLMTSVSGDAMTTVKGAIVMIN
jgi:type VI secretion system secreted protein VgrG